MPSASSDSLLSPSSPAASSRPSLSLVVLVLVLGIALRSSPISSESSRSWTVSPKRRWFSTTFSSRSRSRPARSSINGRHRSTSFRAAGGGGRPVRRSRTIMASASSIGASARSVISSNLPRWKRSSSMAARLLGDALHAPRADRLDARLLDRLEHRAAPAGRPAAGGGAPTASWQATRSAIESAWPRTIAASCGGELARRLGQPRLAADHAGALGRVGHFEVGLARDRAQAARDRALERLGRRFLGEPCACCWRPLESYSHSLSAERCFAAIASP